MGSEKDNRLSWSPRTLPGMCALLQKNEGCQAVENLGSWKI